MKILNYASSHKTEKWKTKSLSQIIVTRDFFNQNEILYNSELFEKNIGTLGFVILHIAPGAQPEIFQGRGGLVRLGHFYKHFIKNTRKKGPAGKSLGVFSPRYFFFCNQLFLL